MKEASKLVVHQAEEAYPVHIGPGLLDQVGRLVRESESGRLALSARCAIVTNSTVGPHYATRVERSLRAGGFDPLIVTLADGERHKTLATVSSLYDQFLEAQLDRRSLVLALGGGVVGDTAGLAAATYWRGVPLVQLPTTLLAMVDASVGGKVAVDHARGKNLIGAFKPPLAVVADTETLATLPGAEWKAGLAEVAKHAIIGDVELFEALERGRASALREDASHICDWLMRAVRVKAEIVGRDPFEQGERAKLNLGHTFGHALEKRSNYELRHGHAVAIGLVCAARLGRRTGLCHEEVAERIELLVGALDLPTRVPAEMAADDIYNQMLGDKKRINGRLYLVLPRGLGDVVVTDQVHREEIIATLETLRGGAQ